MLTLERLGVGKDMLSRNFLLSKDGSICLTELCSRLWVDFTLAPSPREPRVDSVQYQKGRTCANCWGYRIGLGNAPGKASQRAASQALGSGWLYRAPWWPIEAQAGGAWPDHSSGLGLEKDARGLKLHQQKVLKDLGSLGLTLQPSSI